MRGVFIALCAAALLAGIAAGGASAITKPPGVSIVGCKVNGGQATVPAGTDVAIFAGWGTARYGLEFTWLHDVTETAGDGTGLPLVDGVPIADPHQYWNAPIPTTDPTGWVTWWIYDTGITLASGQTMTVDFNEVLAHPLTDGFNPRAGVGSAGPALGPRLCTITGV
jgi:hypothetical protein